MALKKLIDVGEEFPKLKRARLGAAPPVDDVLDNVGAPEISAPPITLPAAVQSEPPKEAQGEDAPRVRTGTKKERSAKRVGQGVHKGSGTDARRYRKTGRTFQFGARVRPDFAEAVKVEAASKNVTIGELLEEMRGLYDSLTEICLDQKMSTADALAQLRTIKRAS